MAETDVAVELRAVDKRFGGVRALRAVDLAIARGRIHALVGENGAGKSTIGKLIAGVIQPSSGEVLVDGEVTHYRAPRDALRAGVTIISQEIALVPSRSVVENVFLGIESVRRGLVDRHALRRRYEALCDVAGFSVPGATAVGELRTADQQKAEILRALAREARIIVMDEPTASLTPDERDRLHGIMRQLQARRVTIVYISHFLDHVLALADAVTVMRDGQVVQTTPTATQTVDSMTTAMLGRPLEVTFPEKDFPQGTSPVVCSVQRLRRAGAVEDVTLEIRAGEIVGLAGLIGSGRTEVARMIFGADRPDSGEVVLEGRQLSPSPRRAKWAGIAMLPESRKDQGLLMNRSVLQNLTVGYLRDLSRLGFVRRSHERATAAELVSRFDVRTDGLNIAVGALSGGNQQKVLFAKWLMRRPRVLIADEPTKGVDVGAKRGIYRLLHDLASDGVAILLISSEVEEIVHLSHRVLVMKQGRICGELDGRSVTERAVLDLAFGQSPIGAGARG